ncbi:MAG TPA: beta-ketoacyl-ACP synthase III [Mycobacteriales bacterium]|jgi:3-oxoacyl-[acyl-carrier-protein] synthase-3|nr:beta-ketoacyl-ACP synthase III [Mycobacteriales bacterium]
MRGPTVIRQASIVGLGEHRATRLVTNDDLAQTLDTDDAWIQQRTGIASRRIAGEGESVIAMASEASRKAVADAGVDPSAVGLVVLATCSMPQSIPGGAAQVAEAIGAIGEVGAYDVNAACAGFCYALSTAADAVRLGTVDYAVVAASERLSDVVDWTDRSSAILFGDGAGSVVIGPSVEAGIGPVVWGSDGTGHELIAMDTGGHLRIEGPAVFRWATSLAGVARAACEAAGVDPSELAALIPHQANLRIINSLAKQLGATDAVVADDVITSGNTSAASVPLALSQLRADGRVAKGDLALTLAFGGGLTYAGAVIAVP